MSHSSRGRCLEPGGVRGTAGQLMACSQGKSGFREPEAWQEKGGPRQAPPTPPLRCTVDATGLRVLSSSISQMK